MNKLLENDQRLAEPTLRGTAWCHAYSAKVDEWLTMLWNDVAGGRDDVALVATGGQGRSDLCPYSDLDLLLLHKGTGVDELAAALWYPMWDTGVKLGHAVRSVDEALSLARDELDVATSFLTARRVAGSHELSQRLIEGSAAQWRNDSRQVLEELAKQPGVFLGHGLAEVGNLADFPKKPHALRRAHPRQEVGLRRQRLERQLIVLLPDALECCMIGRHVERRDQSRHRAEIEVAVAPLHVA